MQRFTNVVAVALFILLLWSPNSFAVGVGFSFDGSSGSGDNDSHWDSVELDSRSAGFGFVLDTSPTNESVFNYRLNVGYGYHKLEQDDGFDFDSNGIYIENTFGFAMVRNENFRWWAGPLVRAGYYTGDSNTQQVGPSVTLKNDVEYGEFGIGAVTGMNFKTGGVVISPSLGFRVSGFFGNNEEKRRDSTGTWSDSNNFEADATSVFANIALLF
jgi:hypothetical protein